jgi:hypothetical protein
MVERSISACACEPWHRASESPGHNGWSIRRFGMSFRHGIQEMMPSGDVGGALRARPAILRRWRLHHRLTVAGRAGDGGPRRGGDQTATARAYYHSAQLGRAEAELRTVLGQDPTEAYALLLLGRTLQRQSKRTEAAPYLRLAAAMRGEPVPEAED